ncbi:hypothetical protein C1646_774527 [Rhizophagus diaphanus]|nr:hypothetical protein C1646_774527 [Rhizophagus diaphanus] [Rhizophagus sp. MUCL 43196]
MNICLEALDDTFWENRSEQSSKNGDSERSSEVSIPLNQPNEETQPGNPGGRPKRDIWQYFMEINNGKGKHKGAIYIRLNFFREIDNERETSETSSTSKIPFVAADSPYFEDFTKSLNSGYNPPKRTTLATTHLDGKLANITLKIEKELGKAKNLTLC